MRGLPYQWWKNTEVWGIAGWGLVLAAVVLFLVGAWFLGWEG